MWYLRLFIWFAVPTHVEQGKGFHWRNNVIIKPYNSELGLMATDFATATGDFRLYYYNDETVKAMMDAGCLGENEYYHAMRSEREY